MAIGRRLASSLERIVYVVAGLPLAIRGPAFAPTPEAEVIRRAFAREYWRPRSMRDAAELALGIVMTPIAVPVAAAWFTARNGSVIRRREGKGLASQFAEQLRFYCAAGIVAPWYYILSLHCDGSRRAPTFLQRCETKRGVYALLKDESPSPIGDKEAFAQGCAAAGLRSAGCELVIDGREIDPEALPDCDLFVKPLKGCGGKGAERWDRIAARSWSMGGETVGDSELVRHFRSKGLPLVVQRRVRPHSALEALTSGALPTVRALTILDEQGQPELVAAVFRMSIGANRTVDNIHAGGLACAVSLGDGTLGIASDLGTDARLGWNERHPTTGAQIQGTRLPLWDEVKLLAVKAHSVFGGRTIIGWDIAIDDEGPLIVEGNRGPDMDLMQRFMNVGFCQHHRFGELIAFHLQARGYGLPRRSSAPGEARATAAPAAAGGRAAREPPPRHNKSPSS